MEIEIHQMYFGEIWPLQRQTYSQYNKFLREQQKRTLLLRKTP